jgi:hypothetical protein
MLEHERPDELPRRPRMCFTCGRPRVVESPAQRPGELVCVECGATNDGGRGFRAELAPDDEGLNELEVPVSCPACWEREFGAEQ